MTNVGITGSRSGPTDNQKMQLANILIALREGVFGYKFDILHHGDCVGVDSWTVGLAFGLDYYTISHPPNRMLFRAYVASDMILEEKPYLQRNRDIVNDSSMMLACPDTYQFKPSGTWSTIYYAKKIGKPIIIIYPDGTGELA